LAHNEHIEADGATVFDQACRMGLAGIVSKRLDARYRSGRSGVKPRARLGAAENNCLNC
jgi:bifunctional non-homologous end joining protein LigD